MEEEKRAENEEQTETAGMTADTEETTDEQENEDTQTEDTQDETEEDATEGDTSDKEDDDSEAKVPSYRLREETQRRKELEAELESIRKSQKSDNQAERINPEELDSQFQEDVNKLGFARAMAKWVQPMAQNIASKEVGNIREYVANQQVEQGIANLVKQHPEASMYSDKIRQSVGKLSFEYKTNPNAVKAAYQNILGEEVMSGKYQKNIEKKTKERLNKDKKILGETAVGDSKGGSTGSTGLTSEQEGERGRMGLSKDSYMETLQYHQKRDKDAGRPVRKTVYNTT